MKSLKLFLTDKNYRFARIESIKVKIISFPIIKKIISWFHVLRFNKEMKNTSSFEQYLALKKFESDTEKLAFVTQLTILEISIMADGENDEMFYEAKSKILGSKTINWPELKEFKTWLEGIDSSEKDYLKVREVRSKFTETT